MRETHRHVLTNISQGMDSMDFLSTILAGFIVGFLADSWLGTSPWLVIVGIVTGSVWGFVKMKRLSDEQLAAEQERLGLRKREG